MKLLGLFLFMLVFNFTAGSAFATVLGPDVEPGFCTFHWKVLDEGGDVILNGSESHPFYHFAEACAETAAAFVKDWMRRQPETHLVCFWQFVGYEDAIRGGVIDSQNF